MEKHKKLCWIQMKCPFCSGLVTRVVDKRSGRAGSGEVRRRRECLKCMRRFTTYERLVGFELLVIKKDGRREFFDKEKLKVGILKALEKRPGVDKVDLLVEKVEKKLRCRGKGEIASKNIGKLVLLELKRVDMVAYLRFASVYRQFEGPEDFTREVSSLVN